MTPFSKMRACVASGYVAIGLTTLAASAHAEVLFDSLSSQNSGTFGDNPFTYQGAVASFNTGASALRLTDVALLLNSSFSLPGDMFTVSLAGGIPLADVTFVDGLGLIFGSPLTDLASVTLPLSGLSSGLTVQDFDQFANITLQPNAFYTINIFPDEQSGLDGALLGWGVTDDDSGPGVATGYNSSYITDFDFFPNKPTPPPNQGGPIFQMEISGVATPEPSSWALMLVGLGGLGLLARRPRMALASPPA